jgi:GT2 family glycosyltransferase
VDEAAPTAPPVVAVVVAHDPGPWFDDVVDGLAAQDYPNLRVLFLDTGSRGDLAARIGGRIPGAFVRPLPDPGSFGATTNEVMGLVEGSGFFCFLHDDVALDADAIRVMVEETYRSNAGLVGPKLVMWETPEHLLEVGSAADKFGTPSPLAEPGELDQEQHDAVRDVFFVPSACLLVRTDLFRALNGFDEREPFVGDALDLCWRAHVAGARVLVVPGARARHRGRLADRRPDLDVARLAARHRLRSVLGNYGRGHLLRVVPQHVVLTLMAAVAAVLTGRFRKAGAELGAWPWNLARWGELRSKRRSVRLNRLVPDREVRTLQIHGSARLSAFFRGHAAGGERLGAVSAAGRNLAATFRTGAPRSSIALWIVLVVLFLVGSRALITDGVAAVGTLLPFPTAATGLLRDYLTSWNVHGLGSAAALPTGLALLGLGGLATFGHMALLRTLLVVLPLLLGYLGAWRLARPFGSQRAKLAAVVVYAAIPLGYNAIATGRWAGVLAYGALPWAVAAVARLSGLEPFAGGNKARPFVARVAGLTLLTAVVTAFIPLFPLVVVATAFALLLGSLPVGGLAAMARAVGGALVAAVAALFLLHLPWGWSLVGRGNWNSLASVPLPGGARLGLDELASLSTGPIRLGWLGWALGIVLLAALLLGGGWRLAWASRATGLVVASVALAWLGDRGTLPFSLPDIEVVLAPAAAGLALAAAAGAAAVDRDVAGTRLSWRQPLGTLAAIALAVLVLPALLAVPDGRWKLGETDFADSLAFLPTQRQAGDFRVLWVGDPRNLPGTPWELAEGLGYSLSSDGPPAVRDLWALAATRPERQVADALALAADGQTARLGRLLAPMSIRYVVLPLQQAPASEGTPTHLPPESLQVALASQLDLEVVDIDDALVLYENSTWIPERAQLSGGAAAASEQAGFETLVRADLSGSTAVLGDGVSTLGAEGDVRPGTVFVGQAVSSRWRLEVDGVAAPRRPAFGWANAFDVNSGGSARLTYDTAPTRWILVAAQVALWLAVIWIAAWSGVRRGRARPASTDASAIIDLGPVSPPSPREAVAVGASEVAAWADSGAPDDGGPAREEAADLESDGLARNAVGEAADAPRWTS